MIPTKYWSRKFIVSPIFPHNYFIVRVYADQDGTVIHFYNSTNHFAEYMNQGSQVEILFGSDPAVIISNKPINVVQYCVDNENMNGDPFMTNVQGIDQFVDSYTFVTQKYFNSESTVAITVKRNNTSGLRLNGKSISSWSTKTVPVPHPMDDHVVMFVNISYNSLFELHHRAGIRFGATLYGLLSTDFAYGYPLQMMLSNAGTEYGKI
ncbi:uncharacterized protein LOC128551539 [Mercenaria mercenaria]|uniref:uncharacterized protein LOC128551539 n=1 Tax=Mercenaria mercenaria TaxID=6596 RepID=UPI00234E9FB6|nr:uncharacterized protein LOC128551539 [Mercenaria mercenaria]